MSPMTRTLRRMTRIAGRCPTRTGRCAKEISMNAPMVDFDVRRLIPDGVFDPIARKFGSRFSSAHAVCEHHGRDESPYPPMLPDAVVFASSTEEVAWLAGYCNQHRVPLIPYGAGSSLEGHLLAVQGGISVDLSGMNQVISVNAEDLTATVQAGVRTEEHTSELQSLMRI